jgi:hypothetical protein
MTSPEVAANKPPSVWEDFLDIFYAPSEVFARRENGKFGLQLALIIVATMILYYATYSVLSPIYEAMSARQMEEVMRRNPQLTQEQLRQGQGFQRIIGGVVIAVFTGIGVLLVGLVLWLSGKLFESQATLRSMFVVATYSYIPRLLEWVAFAVQGALLDAAQLTNLTQLSLGPARFMDPATTSPLVLTLAFRFSVFILWGTILLAIGLKVTGKIPIAKAAAAAFLVWLLGAIPTYFQFMQAQ